MLLLVVAHHRPDSLTAQIAARARTRFEAAGYAVDLLDLHAERFDPRMTTADEPDWRNPGKTYSPEVCAHIRRIITARIIVVVFPVWWSAPPAILKGWIDRVWNFGFAYGSRRLSGKKMIWIGLTGGSAQDFARYRTGELLDRQLRVEISHFCGISEAAVRLIHDADHAAGNWTRFSAEADAVLDEVLAGLGAAGSSTRDSGYQPL